MAKHPDRLEKLFSPGPRFFWGMALIILTGISTQWWILVPSLTVYYILARVAGKRIRVFYFLFLMFSVAFFHLLVPYGPIWFKVGTFPITLGALEEGLRKGVTLTALVFISLFSVSSKLRLPGALGDLLAQVFFFFERLWEVKKHLDPKHWVQSADLILKEIWETPAPENRIPDPVPRASWGIILMILTTAALVLGLILGR